MCVCVYDVHIWSCIALNYSAKLGKIGPILPLHKEGNGWSDSTFEAIWIGYCCSCPRKGFHITLCVACFNWDERAPGKYLQWGWNCTEQCSWKCVTGSSWQSHPSFQARWGRHFQWNASSTVYRIIHWPKIQIPWLPHSWGQSQRSTGCEESLSAAPSEGAAKRTPLSVKWLLSSQSLPSM